MTNELILEEFQANSFMGISSDQPCIIDFTSRKKNQNITEFVADQAKGKSSRLLGLLYAMGARFDIDKKQLINLADGKIQEGLKFTWKGTKYHVIVSTNRVEVKKFSEDAEKWTKIDEEPMQFLRDVFGPVGLSPFQVRSMKPRKQIEYFQEMFGGDSDAAKKIEKLEKDIDTVFEERKEINRDVKTLSAALEAEPLYQSYEKSQERFSKPVSAANEKKKYDDLYEKKTAYEKYQNVVDITEGELKDKQNKIADLEQQLAKAREEEKTLSESLDKGKAWLNTNKNILAEFEQANKEWLNLSQKLVDYEKWKAILQKEKQLNEKQEESITKTGELDEKREKLLKLTKSCIPKVEGLEVKLVAGLDKTKEEEGIFYQGKSISILSESEYISMWCLIFEAAGMNVIVLENLTSLGSDAVKTLNLLAKNGAQIFATKMLRGQKDVKVVFSSKIE